MSGPNSDVGDSEVASNRHERLAKWIRERGGSIHPSIAIMHSENSGYRAIVRTGETVPEGTVIASCPVEATMSVLNVFNMSPMSNHGTAFPLPFLDRFNEDTDILQTFFLMEQYMLGSKSWWHLYLDTLPTVKDVKDLQYTEDADLAWIQGTNLAGAMMAQQRRWESQYREAIAVLEELKWENAINGSYTYDLYLWASTIYGSRSFSNKVLDGTRPAELARPLGQGDPNHDLLEQWFSNGFGVLLPLADIFNHHPDSKIWWLHQPDEVTLKVGQEYKAGEEVFNNYGQLSSDSLMLSYRFVLDENPYDQALIGITAHEDSLLRTTRSWPRPNEADENFSCYILDANNSNVKHASFLERALFSYDLLDSISVECCNAREVQEMFSNERTAMATSLNNKFQHRDFRNLLDTLGQMMLDSGARAEYLESCDPSRSHNGSSISPSTQKQKSAHVHRQKQTNMFRTAEAVCAFVLLHACTNHDTEELLKIIETKAPRLRTAQMQTLCRLLPCVSNKQELFTSSTVIDLLPPTIAELVRTCSRRVEDAILESVPAHERYHKDKTKTIYTIMLSALCLAARSGARLSQRVSIWIEDLTASYPPDDPHWNEVPEKTPEALMYLLAALPKVKGSLSREDQTLSWLEPRMICWAWNVMEEEGVRLPAEIEEIVTGRSVFPAESSRRTSYLLYCKQAPGADC